jgi:hypothetical protein
MCLVVAILDVTDYKACPDNVPGSSNLVSADVPAHNSPQTAQNQDDENEQ